jgi:kinesin family protein 18/19
MTSTSVSNVLVAVRIRPLNAAEISSGVKSCIQTFDGKVVAIKRNGDAGQYLKSQQTCINEYEYDAVFDEQASQQVIYEKTARNYIPKIADGQNVTVFAYGATGAGKTHTMLGDTRTLAPNHNGNSKIPSVGNSASSSSHHHGGIIPNAVKDLFRLVSAKMASKNQLLHNEQYSIYLSFLEVYNEQVYDLLESSGKILSVQEDQQKGIVIVSGVTEQHVTTYSQVIDFIIQGNKQRKTESTCANALSSRSHAVLQLIVKKSTKLENGKEVITESKLSLIDLAGSERASATNNRGLRLVEGANINKSLLALANCINALSENNSVSSSSSSSMTKLKNVKFRDSKLTHLLKSSLEGNCHLIMIANINPSDSTYEDSHNTLKYSNRAKNIKINPLINSKENKEVNWMEREIQLRNENNQLKAMIINLQIQVKDLSEFKQYVLTHKSIPGTKGKFYRIFSFPFLSSIC